MGLTKTWGIETMNLMSEPSMMANRTVRVGIDDAPPPPMQFGNPDTGDFRGYEVDLLEEIGRRVGFRLSFRRALWSVIIHELKAGDVDLVCSAATVTPEREREVDFCVPHLRLALAVVKRDGIIGGNDIKSLRLGVRSGTTAEAYARQHGTSEPAQISESNEELYASLAAGELDAIIDDSPIAMYFSQFVAGLQFAGVIQGTEGAYAIMVRKGNDKLRAEINRALGEMENDGTQQRLLSKWLGDDCAEEGR
ncbi:MAG: ABC transporter substrate-binding protein [Candidatus Sulfotelmatobacter sp.]